MLASAAATPAPNTTMASATFGAFSIEGCSRRKLARSNSAATPFKMTRKATARLAYRLRCLSRKRGSMRTISTSSRISTSSAILGLIMLRQDHPDGELLRQLQPIVELGHRSTLTFINRSREDFVRYQPVIASQPESRRRASRRIGQDSCRLGRLRTAGSQPGGSSMCLWPLDRLARTMCGSWHSLRAEGVGEV